MGSAYLQVLTPENCHATGKGLKVATVNEKATAAVYVLDHHENPYILKIDRMTCELTSDKQLRVA